jgi:hypothetical protein
MSGYANISAVPDQNILFNAASGMTTSQVQRNQLLNQEAQQTIGANEIGMMARAASSILQLPEDQQAAAYPQAVAELQRQGFAKNAPSIYPGADTLRRVQAMGLTLPEQYQYGVVTAPGLQGQIDAILGKGATPPTGTTPGAGASGGGGTSEFNYGNIRPVGGTGFNTYATPQDGIAAMSSNLAAYANQHGINTLNGLTARWAPKGDGANDPVAYAKRLGAALGIDPDAEINLADPLLQTRLIPAMAAVEKGRPFDQPSDVLTAGIQKGLGRGGTTVAVAGPGGGVVARNPGSVQVAGPGAPPASTAPATATPDLVGPRPLPAMTANAPVVTPESLANTPVPAAPPPARPNQVLPGSPNGPPAPAVSAAAQPGSRGNLPSAASLPSGVNSQQYQQAVDLQRKALALDALVDPTGRAKVLAAGLRQQAQLLLQTDSVVQTQEGQFHPLSGKIDEAAKPLADYHETTPGSGIWVGGPGTEPRFQPPGRLIIDKAGDVWRTTSGGAEKLSRLDPTAVAALNEAEAAGTATGKAVAQQLPDIMAQARDAAAQEGQIDYASNQLREAAKGGIPSGYFSQGLATAAAAAKSLGIDTSSLGVNPEAVGNAQTAQKTLSVIGGAILRQALGPGSAITDAKVEQFIHTQPGIETDPQALQRIMGWARSQYTYTRELGQAAVTEAAKPENAGRLPPHWLAAYYRDHGFAPIYDPGTQEMRQPDGAQPARVTPASQPATTAPSRVIQYDANGKRIK